VAAATFAALGLGLGACGDDGDDGDDPTPSETTGADETSADDASGSDGTASGQTTEGGAPEDQAVAAYQESWDATFEATAADPPEVSDEIRDLMTGEALAETESLVGTLAREGKRIEGSMETHTEVVAATSEEVLFDDCAVENSVEYTGAEQTGVVENEAWNYRVRVVNEDGAWKVADFERREDPCTPS
jgi:hypothetical protein